MAPQLQWMFTPYGTASDLYGNEYTRENFMDGNVFYWDQLADLSLPDMPTIKGAIGFDGELTEFAYPDSYTHSLYAVHESTFGNSPSEDCSNYHTDWDVCS